MTFDPDLDLIDLRSMQCDACAAVKELKGGWENYLMEPKLDGFRLVCHVRSDHVDMYTREMKLQNGKLPYIDTRLRQLFPMGTVVDGEAIGSYIEEKAEGIKHVVNDFEQVQSIMLSKPDRAVEQARLTRPLGFSVFDIMFLENKDVRTVELRDRKSMLRRYLGLGEMVAGPGEVKPLLWDYASESRHQSWYNMGFEGTVAKYIDGAYVSGTRGKGWYKIKPQRMVDVIVLDFIPGEGKYAGQIGSLVFGQPVATMPVKLKEKATDIRQHPKLPGHWYAVRGSCSGMTDEMRLQISKNPGDWLGRMIEIKHMGLMAGGIKFRHPQFSRVRDDKPLNELVWHDR